MVLVVYLNYGNTEQHEMVKPDDGFEIWIGSGQYFGKVKDRSDQKGYEVVARWSYEDYESAIEKDPTTRLLYVKNNINHILDVMHDYFKQVAVNLKQEMLDNPNCDKKKSNKLKEFLDHLWMTEDLSKSSVFCDSDYNMAATLFQQNKVLAKKIMNRRYFASGPNCRHFLARTEQQIKTDFNTAKERYQQKKEDQDLFWERKKENPSTKRHVSQLATVMCVHTWPGYRMSKM